MKYGLLKYCQMSWEKEEHSFTFDTGGNKITALDSLGDLINSLQDLYAHIHDTTSYGSSFDMPRYYKVRGGYDYTNIEVKK
jgi:hypothetical protein